MQFPSPRLTSAFPLLVLIATVTACSDLTTEPEPTPLQPITDAAPLLTRATPPFVGCVNGTLAGGALSRICFPPDWNGDAVLWAHGYVSPFEPLALPADDVEGVPVEAIVLGLRYAYATTSYRANGLVAVDAIEDLTQLANAVRSASFGALRFAYLVGASEGGLATALSLERAAAAFDGGLIACAPVGSFRGQINYFGDVRVLFDVFFPGLLPGDPLAIPAALIAGWDGTFEPAVRAALAANPGATAQLISVGGIAVDPANPASAIESVVDALWYNVFATNDARMKLGGVPYGNRFRWYRGSSNDLLLNLRVRRVRADAAALVAMRAYEATGGLRRPAQMTHTRYDPVVPFWQSQIYQIEALFGSGLNLLSIPSDNYGHCAFDVEEVLASFALLVLRVTGRNLLATAESFPDPGAIARFRTLAREGGAQPVVRSAAELARRLPGPVR